MGLVRLEFCDLTKRFAGRGGNGQVITAVERVSFSVEDGEVVSLIGPSGCGKSTLLNIASGLDQPSEGAVFVDSERVTEPNAHVAILIVFFPASMPPLFSGLRIAATLAVIGIVVDELVGGNTGLGYLLVFGEGQANTPMVFVTIILLTIIGIIAYVAIILLERKVLHYLLSRDLEAF